jgi:hypothetical protein
MRYWAATHVKGLSPEITLVSEADVFMGRKAALSSQIVRIFGLGIEQGASRHGEAMRARLGSETVARYQRASRGTREAPSALLTGVCDLKRINGKVVQMALWESDQPIVPKKRGNACGGKELAEEPLGPGYIHRTKRRVKDGNKTGPITYPGNNRAVLLKSRMSGERENLVSGSVRGLIAASGRR